MEVIAGVLILTASLLGLVTELIKFGKEANRQEQEPIDRET